MFRDGEVTKVYVALVSGDWPKRLHQVNAPLMKSQVRGGERMVAVDDEGKESLTMFEVRERFGLATLMEATLVTGRTHQIRVHTLHTGHPIAGDGKYGDKEFNKKIRDFGCRRLFLHAEKLSFKLDGKTIEVVAPLDSELKSCLKELY